jgi:RNA polymerase sigma-70 factor (ECF subfamily)
MPTSRSAATLPHTERPGAQVVALRTERADEELVQAVVAGDRWAKAQLFDRFAPDVERIVRRLVGRDADLDVEDVVHDAFVAAFGSISGLEDPAALPKWMATVAARSAYRAIRRKRLGRWLKFWEPERLREVVESSDVDTHMLSAYRQAYALIARLPAAERVAFVLRYVEGMELTEVADACDVSLATAKRHLARAKERFVRAAARDEVLCNWVGGGEP